MAEQVLTLTWNESLNTVVESGMTTTMGKAMRQFLRGHGIDLSTSPGRIICPEHFDVPKRAAVVTDFNRRFNHPWNPQGGEADSTTLINEDPFAAADVTLTVDDGAQFAQYDYIRIEDELLFISAIGGHNLTVTRGEQGTLDVAHGNNTAIYIVPTFSLVIATA